MRRGREKEKEFFFKKLLQPITRVSINPHEDTPIFTPKKIQKTIQKNNNGRKKKV
jgi:hypothetical protein